MKALIITATGFQDQEGIYPYYRLKGAGFEVTVLADRRDERKRVYGIMGVGLPCDILIGSIATHNISVLDLDLMVIPGGVKAMEKLRTVHEVRYLIHAAHMQRRVIASICSGAQLLISADIVRDRAISGHPAMAVDIGNAGAIYADKLVTDGNIVTAPHYDDLGEWMEEVLRVCAR